MSKQEFLAILRGRITGNIPTGEVEAQIDYYSAYIDGRIGAGLTEEEAVSELGDPLLIAKTVIESTDRAAEAAGYDGPYQRSRDTYADSDGINSGIFGESGPSNWQQQTRAGESPYGNMNGQRSAADAGSPQGEQKSSSAGSLGCIIAVIVLVLVMALGWVLTSFVFGMTFRLLGWFFPVIAIGGIIALVVTMARRK